METNEFIGRAECFLDIYVPLGRAVFWVFLSRTNGWWAFVLG